MLRIRTTRINITNETIHMIVLSNGNFARTTNGEIFKTADYSFAKEALQYVEKGDPKTASHRVKSTFGTL